MFIDGFDTSRFWTANQARKAIRQLGAGFTAAGLFAGDCVCIASFNDLNYPILVRMLHIVLDDRPFLMLHR